ncbi:Flagellar protein FlgJ [peptidoglycan hydrolase] [hydrothermal vent metagenome]|uniref:Flagellar protein FlgJ [peptidoglycan hydrolase] n=1 Tax=hydrothermal vent metagenome TaxID=652676 RepID=A0A3B0WCQ8_9ZZZZ
MDSIQNISDAGLYTDFNGLQKLRAKVSGGEKTEESQAASKEVAEQFESLFLQMMLKSMRDATVTGDSEESQQTRFYQEMFDKQIALDLANNNNGGGIGIAAMLERDMLEKDMGEKDMEKKEIGGSQQQNLDKEKAENNVVNTLSNNISHSIALVRNQINFANATLQTNNIREQE